MGKEVLCSGKLSGTVPIVRHRQLLYGVESRGKSQTVTPPKLVLSSLGSGGPTVHELANTKIDAVKSNSKEGVSETPKFNVQEKIQVDFSSAGTKPRDKLQSSDVEIDEENVEIEEGDSSSGSEECEEEDVPEDVVPAIIRTEEGGDEKQSLTPATR
ncbi:hypothetical protein U1Q18_014938 [Sarracenia purpurea var. burkii]